MIQAFAATGAFQVSQGFNRSCRTATELAVFACSFLLGRRIDGAHRAGCFGWTHVWAFPFHNFDSITGVGFFAKNLEIFSSKYLINTLRRVNINTINFVFQNSKGRVSVSNMLSELKLPLRVEDDYIVDADGNDVADCGQGHVTPNDDECAALLVQAANGYATMREAVEAALEYAERCTVESKLTEKLRAALAGAPVLTG